MKKVTRRKNLLNDLLGTISVDEINNIELVRQETMNKKYEGLSHVIEATENVKNNKNRK